MAGWALRVPREPVASCRGGSGVPAGAGCVERLSH